MRIILWMVMIPSTNGWYNIMMTICYMLCPISKSIIILMHSRYERKFVDATFAPKKSKWTIIPFFFCSCCCCCWLVKNQWLRKYSTELDLIVLKQQRQQCEVHTTKSHSSWKLRPSRILNSNVSGGWLRSVGPLFRFKPKTKQLSEFEDDRP